MSPKSIALSGTDIGRVENRGKIGYMVENNFEDALEDCDVVLALKHSDKFKDYVKDNLDKAMKARKTSYKKSSRKSKKING